MTNTQLEVVESFGEDAGLGTGGLSIDEQRLPFLVILHQSSPQCLRGNEKAVSGATAGMLYNTATQELYDGDQGVEFLCAWREKVYTAWLPRDDGGGFRGVLQADDPTVQRAIAENVQRHGRRGRFGKIPHHDPIEDEDQELVEQWNMGMVYGYPELNPENAQRAIMAFTSTKIKNFVSWVQRANLIEYTIDGKRQRPPAWGQRWRLTTTPTSNKQGSWFVPAFSQATPGPIATNAITRSHPLYLQGREFYALWADNKVQADYAPEEEEVATTDEVTF